MAKRAKKADANPAKGRPSNTQWLGWIEESRRVRQHLLDNDWRQSVNYRVMKPFGLDEDSPQRDRVAVPEDWARTRQKTAQLASRIPRIVAKATRPEHAPMQATVTAAVNEYLKRCRFGYVLDENLADVINASGLMACAVGVDIRTESVEVEVPYPPIGTDPITGEVLADPRPPETRSVEQVVYKGFTIDRISPGALLWPSTFTGSDWARAPWLGYDAMLPVPEIRRRWGSKIPASFKGSGTGPMLVSKDVQPGPRRTGDDGESEVLPEDSIPYGRVTTIWYRASDFDETVKHPHHMRRLVFVEGIEAPVEEGDTDWQEWVPPRAPGVELGQDGQPVETPGQAGYFRGLCRNPIVVHTLNYVSDLAVPPSDSQAARPQVNEMMRSRSQMIRQRDHSVPVRWYDVNRLDEFTVQRLQQGEWLDMIPVNGPGDRIIGEVARAAYPRENFQFASVIGADLDRTWAMSNTQLGLEGPGSPTATEVATVSGASDIRLAYEKDRVGHYVTETGEVLFSLMQRFLDDTDYVEVVGENGREVMAAFNKDTLAGQYVFSFKSDSSDRVDNQTRIDRTLKAYNLLANSPTTNRASLEAELWDALGFDSAKMMVKPPEQGPPPANISFRFSGEDLLSPVAVAVMLKSGYDIGQDVIKAAQMLIRDAVVGMKQLVAQPQMTQGTPGVPTEGAVPQEQGEVTPPTPAEPILKRLNDGTRMM